jgi:hypothetical protein
MNENGAPQSASGAGSEKGQRGSGDIVNWQRSGHALSKTLRRVRLRSNQEEGEAHNALAP